MAVSIWLLSSALVPFFICFQKRAVCNASEILLFLASAARACSKEARGGGKVLLLHPHKAKARKRFRILGRDLERGGKGPLPPGPTGSLSVPDSLFLLLCFRPEHEDVRQAGRRTLKRAQAFAPIRHRVARQILAE